MTYFPVTNSTLSAEHISLFLQEQYSLSPQCSCQILKAGINDSYLITDGQMKYVFRVYSFGWRTRTEITEEIKLLLQLKENGIPVSYPLPDKNNSYIHTLKAPEGERYAVLFSYAPGEKQHLIPEEIHYKIGQLMARFHKISIGQEVQRIHYTKEVLLLEPLERIAAFLKKDTEEMNFMRQAQAFLLKEFSEADTSQLRSGIVHLDIWFDNLNITQDQQVTLFDFDFCGNGWLCLDIAYYILQLHNIERYEVKDYQPKVDQFYKGYESITPISDEEKRLIPMLGISLYFFYLGIQCQRYDNWSNSFLNENYLKRFINGLVKRYYEIYELGN